MKMLNAEMVDTKRKLKLEPLILSPRGDCLSLDSWSVLLNFFFFLESALSL